MFAARTEMNENPYNYGNKILCEMVCKEAQTNKHIFVCLQRNKEEKSLIYDNILNGTHQKKILTFQKFQENIEKKKPTPGFS